MESLYNGLAGGRRMGWTEVIRQIPWDAWMPPLLAWGGFVLVCYFVMVCMVNMVLR